MDQEHEAIQLRLGQGIGALLLHGVLRGQHEKGRGEMVEMAARGDAVLLHRLQQGGLRLGRGAVDLVRQHDIGENGALHILKAAPAGLVGLLEDLRAGNVGGHQIGSKLDAAEIEGHGIREAADEERLGEAGDADEEGMPAAKDGNEEPLDDFLLADNDAGQLRAHALGDGPEAVDGGDIVVGRRSVRNRGRSRLFIHGGVVRGTLADLGRVARRGESAHAESPAIAERNRAAYR